MAQTTTTLPRYQPSGFIRPTAVALFLAATVCAALVAWPYQLLVRWIPVIQLQWLGTVAFGAGLGFAAAWAIKTGHCRNMLLGVALALPLGLMAVAASHYWNWKQSAPDIEFKDFIDARVEGGWNVSHNGGSSSNSNGVIVWLVWAAEALTILGFVMAGAWKAVSAPYCERCNQWGSERKMVLRGLKRSDADPLLQAGDLDGVIGLTPPPDANVSVALLMTATTCPSCKDTGFLTVEEKQVIAKKKGKPQEKSVTLIKHAVLRADQREKFRARLEPGIPA